MSKGARVRQQRVQAPQRRGGKRVKTPAAPGQDSSRRNLYIGVIGAAVLLAIVLVGASVLSSRSSSSPKTASIASVAATNKLLAGIHQGGTVLGNPNAPVTMQEFADIQCPGCDQYMKSAFPDIVRKYVRTGKVKVDWNGIAFIGPDSEKGLRFVNGAGKQNKLWNVAELLYQNQGAENSGWVTSGLLRSVGAAVPGVDVNKVEQDASSPAVSRQMAAAANNYSTYGFNQTPSFAIGPTGGALQPFSPSAYNVGAFGPTFDKYIQQSKQ